MIRNDGVAKRYPIRRTVSVHKDVENLYTLARGRNTMHTLKAAADIILDTAFHRSPYNVVFCPYSYFKSSDDKITLTIIYLPGEPKGAMHQRRTFYERSWYIWLHTAIYLLL